MSEKLKPCPFCGRTPNPDWTDESYIECTNRKCSLYGYGMSTGDWNIRPIEDALNTRIAELDAEVTKGHELQDAYCDRIAELENELEGKRVFTDTLFYDIYRLQSRIAELEAEIDQLTADSTDERKDDKLLEREVCEACGGDGTLLLTDGYEGQVMATAKCIYCNGTGRVNKECEE